MKQNAGILVVGVMLGALLMWCIVAPTKKPPLGFPSVILSSSSGYPQSNIFQWEYDGGVTFRGTTELGGAFYVTNIFTMAEISTFLLSTSYQAALAPKHYFVEDGKLVQGRPRHFLAPVRQELGQPETSDASAWSQYFDSRRTSLDTFTDRPMEIKIDLNE